MNTIISKMKYDDIWCTDDICAVLSGHNHEIGDELVFRDLLYSAKKSKKVEAINEPFLLDHTEEYKRYNFEYKQEEIITWILSKSFVFPISSNKNASPNKKVESINMNVFNFAPLNKLWFNKRYNFNGYIFQFCINSIIANELYYIVSNRLLFSTIDNYC